MLQKRLLLSLLLLITPFATTQSVAAENSDASLTIAILTPIKLPAIDEIIQGLQTKLTTVYHQPINYLIKSAEGDLNIERSIVEQFKSLDDTHTIIVPIGTVATQMTIATIETKPIIGIALSDPIATQPRDANAPILLLSDEIPPEQQLTFIKTLIPDMTSSERGIVTIVHSGEKRIFQEVERIKQNAPQEGIEIQDLMVQQISDIYSISQSIDPKSRLILVLKDELVISAIPALIRVAQELHIPLMTSDDGSVRQGAAFALGFSENALGQAGGEIIQQLLCNTDQAAATACADQPTADLSFDGKALYTIQHDQLFINTQAAPLQGVDPKQIADVAQSLHYVVTDVTPS